jgi:hypothetical protein
MAQWDHKCSEFGSSLKRLLQRWLGGSIPGCNSPLLGWYGNFEKMTPMELKFYFISGIN